MRYRLQLFAIAAMLFSAAACNSGRYSSSGFHLPKDGDVARGKRVFVELGCTGCHQVAGTDLASAAVTPVCLGGESSRRLSNAYLLTAILNPDYHLTPNQPVPVTAGGHSRMPSYTDRITARQLVDLIAYLQSTYTIRTFTPNYYF